MWVELITTLSLTLFLLLSSILTYAPLPSSCADVASRQSRSVFLCPLSPEGLALTHTCIYMLAHRVTVTHTSACHRPRGQLPPMATRSQSFLINVPLLCPLGV